MPIYEYRCTKCGHRFEVLQKVGDRPLNKCERCKGKAERLISSPAIQFKGSGWYITDYARKGHEGQKDHKESSSESSRSDASSESSSTEKSSSEKSSGKKSKQKAGSSK